MARGLVVAAWAAVVVGCASNKTEEAPPATAERSATPGDGASAGMQPGRELPSLRQERSRAAADGAKDGAGPGGGASAGANPSSRALPTLAEERARTSGAPIALPESLPAGLSGKPGMPEWWLTDVRLADGRYAACAEADGVSFIGARQVALDQAVARLRESIKSDPSDLRTDRITSVQSGGMVRVRVRVSCAGK